MSAPNSSMVDKMWKLFKEKRVKIASEIKCSYPFFHILRDKEVILQEDFEKWLRKIDSNPEAIKEVIYDVLGGINNESALWEIFCEENLDAYPNLKPIYQELKNVLQCAETRSASERKSTEVPNPEKKTPEIFTRKQRLKCAARTKRTVKSNCQRELISRWKMTGLPKGKRTQKRKNVIRNFPESKLNVRCGKARGVLYKDKYAAATSEKSIENSDGRWLTLSEFEAEGGRGRWKNWKKSIQWGWITLEELIKRGHLVNPPRKRRRTKRENDLCSVCSSGGSLIRCDLCRKAFHGSCHVPDVPSEKSMKWICTFCKLKNKPKNTAFCREDQVKRRKMLPLQRLKCEFLLLTIWCQTESNIFAEDPTTVCHANRETGIQKPMWLRKVEEKLHQKQYETVEDFKNDMCQIFQNFQESNKDKEIAKDGKKLQKKFEQSFQKVFRIKQPGDASRILNFFKKRISSDLVC